MSELRNSEKEPMEDDDLSEDSGDANLDESGDANLDESGDDDDEEEEASYQTKLAELKQQVGYLSTLS